MQLEPCNQKCESEVKSDLEGGVESSVILLWSPIPTGFLAITEAMRANVLRIRLWGPSQYSADDGVNFNIAMSSDIGPSGNQGLPAGDHNSSILAWLIEIVPAPEIEI